MIELLGSQATVERLDTWRRSGGNRRRVDELISTDFSRCAKNISCTIKRQRWWQLRISR